MSVQATAQKVESFLDDQPLIILNELTAMHFSMGESFPSFLTLEKDITYKVLDTAGIGYFENYRLPENFDPTRIYHGPSVKRLGYYLSNYKISEFDVKVNRDGERIKIRSKNKTVYKESFETFFLFEYEYERYRIEKLKIGDVVNIHYTIEIPIYENFLRFASYRIFFNGELPKIKSQLILTYPKTLPISLFAYNGAMDNLEKEEDESKFRYSWEFEYLHGNLMEEGGRPYLELPHICWKINVNYITDLSNRQVMRSSYLTAIFTARTPKLNSILISNQIGNQNSQYLTFDKKFKELTDSIDNHLEQIKYIHNYIANHYKYENDIELYRRNDSRDERLGEYFETEILRDYSRYHIYYSFLCKYSYPFYAAFILDKRSGEIGKDYYQPAYDNDFLLATHENEYGLGFMLPKNSSFGWYYNELPFYWEDSKASLVDISDFVSWNRNVVKRRTVEPRTHSTATESNLRKAEFQVNVDIKKDSLYFDGMVLLSGQFSTICRPIYLNKKGDPTVNRKYRLPIWRVDDLSKYKSTTASISDTSPFTSEFKCTYSSGISKSETADLRSIDCSSWFRHILPDKVYDNRQLAYFVDFEGKDEYRYSIEFPSDIKLQNDTVIQVNNPFGMFYFQLAQRNPETIEVISALEFKEPGINAEQYYMVNDLVSASSEIPMIKYKIID